MSSERFYFLCLMIVVLTLASSPLGQSLSQRPFRAVNIPTIERINQTSESHSPHALAGNPSDDRLVAQQSAQASIAYLAQVMDQFHNRFPIYDDVSSAGNHFPA